ncbi:MAG: DUF115 domain-containing protein [Treponema sp.]|nr:DUF115 domain-containing protein [Treponema sp.]
MIEPGLGYIIPVLKEKFPGGKIIVLHVDKAHYNDNCYNSHCAIPALCSADKTKINFFLETEVPDTDTDKIRIIEWRPSMNFYKKEYVNLFSEVVNFLKRTDAGRRTTKVFGTRWVKNFFNNLEIVKKNILYRQTNIPVIVTGAGPGLEQSLEYIAKMQEHCLIIAASSSYMALSSNGIQADIIIATDGGSWALKHIYPVFRNSALPFNKNENIFAVNLCAALPSQNADTPFLIMNDGSFWQSLILHELGIPSVIIGQKGTVAACGIELALLLSSGNVYLAGMDFSINDIRTHIKPYAFDCFFEAQSNRFAPFYSKSFKRSGLLKEGGSLNIYDKWFKTQLQLWPKRIFNITEKKPDTHTPLKNTKEIFKTKNINSSNTFSKRAKETLFSALNNPKYADNVTRELAALLLPDFESSDETKNALRKTLKNLFEDWERDKQ